MKKLIASLLAAALLAAGLAGCGGAPASSGGAAASCFLQSTLHDRLSCLVDRTSEKPDLAQCQQIVERQFSAPCQSLGIAAVEEVILT